MLCLHVSSLVQLKWTSQFEILQNVCEQQSFSCCESKNDQCILCDF